MMKMSLFTGLFILLNVFTLLEITVAFTIFTPKIETNNTVCKTVGCQTVASHVLEAMDQQVNPCVNFYNFACGNFVKKTTIPNDQILVRTFSTVHSKVQDQLRSMLNERIIPNEPKSFSMAKQLYKSCMNEILIERHGLNPLTNIIEELGGWPVIQGDKWNQNWLNKLQNNLQTNSQNNLQWDWTKTVADFRKMGLPTSQILRLSVKPNVEKSTTQIISIFPLSSSLTSMSNMNDKTLSKFINKYHDFMVEMAVIFGANRHQAAQELMESLKFEIELIKNTGPGSADFTSKSFKLQELQWKYPFIQWVKYINDLLPSATTVNENEIIILRNPYYFDRLGVLIKETPKRVIANYLIWKIVTHSTYYMTKDLRRRQHAIEMELNGVRPQQLRWKECTNILNERLPIACGAMYVRKYFHNDTKVAVLDMVNRIRTEFEHIVNEVKWMDEKTRQFAVAKLKAMTPHIGYPDELMDDGAIENYYRGLEIDENDYLTSILKLNKFNTEQDFSVLHKPVNKSDWRIDPHAHAATVNGFHSRFENSIQFPAGILQGQFFSIDRPLYMNFGAIGSIIGHELTHGLDDRGSLVGINGEFNNWWQYETGIRFIDKIKCIVEQYESYVEPITGLKLNGTQTQSENIADNAGIKEAYRAYQKWAKDNGPEPYLPGLQQYSPEQMFWISAAQVWCSVRRPESMRNLVTHNEHAPDPFRVLGSFSNRIEFANDFNCPKGSPMNPLQKCDVW